MIRLLLAIAGALALTGCGVPERDWPAPSPALWEVTGADGTRGWLFGTIHALPEGAEWRTSIVDAALGNAGVLVVEAADMADNEARPTAWQMLAVTPGQPPLTQRVPHEQADAVKTALDKAGLDEADFADLETWAAALTLANALREENGEGVDLALMRGYRGHVTRSLEGVTPQLAIFDRLQPEDQSDLLAAVAERATSDPAAEERIARLWWTGDIDGIEAETHRGILTDPGLREALLVARNRDWAEQIEPLLRSGEKPFVAVGAGHLVGADGLPALLAARGYTVRRIQ